MLSFIVKMQFGARASFPQFLTFIIAPIHAGETPPLSSRMSQHRLRRGASHLPARRARAKMQTLFIDRPLSFFDLAKERLKNWKSRNRIPIVEIRYVVDIRVPPGLCLDGTAASNVNFNSSRHDRIG